MGSNSPNGLHAPDYFRIHLLRAPYTVFSRLDDRRPPRGRRNVGLDTLPYLICSLQYACNKKMQLIGQGHDDALLTISVRHPVRDAYDSACSLSAWQLTEGTQRCLGVIDLYPIPHKNRLIESVGELLGPEQKAALFKTCQSFIDRVRFLDH